MAKKAFDKIIAGLEDAAAYLAGDVSRGVTYTISPVDVAGIRKKLGLSQGKFAAKYGLDTRAAQQWEQGRRQPERSARVLLRAIELNPELIEEAARLVST